jgi:hypothetical protein
VPVTRTKLTGFHVCLRACPVPRVNIDKPENQQATHLGIHEGIAVVGRDIDVHTTQEVSIDVGRQLRALIALNYVERKYVLLVVTGVGSPAKHEVGPSC